MSWPTAWEHTRPLEHADVVIERAAIGGQAGTSSHIRNYPGFPYGLSGAELAARTGPQAWLRRGIRPN